MKSEQIALTVDLDGTLLRTDSLWESLFAMLRNAPGQMVTLLPALLCGGRAGLKAACALYALPGIPYWPYDPNVLKEIQLARQAGRPVWLVTAADSRIAEAVADHLGCFDGVLSTQRGHNLKGEAKVQKLRMLWGEQSFDYIGNSKADMPVWKIAREAIVVRSHCMNAFCDHASSASTDTSQCSDKFVSLVIQINPHFRCLNSTQKAHTSRWMAAIRTHQWLKNILIAVPTLLAHKFSIHAFTVTIAAFFCFSLCASANYLINDLLDLDADRRHPNKRFRPFAAGQLPLPCGVLAAMGLLGVSVAGACALSPDFAFALLCYLTLALTYSHVLKKVLIADALCLGMLYTLRIIAGAAALGLTISNWLLAFSFFIFMGLAFVKRLGEMRALQLKITSDKCATERHNPSVECLPGRGYRFSDSRIIETIATASGFAALMILALYIESVTALRLYATPRVLWGICIVILYWYCRLLLLTHRGEINDDPVAFVSKDKVSMLCGCACAAFVLLAM